MVLGFRFCIRTKKDPALKIICHFSTGQTDPGLGHIDETYNPIHNGTGFFPFGVKGFHFFWNSHDQGTMDSAGIEESFTAGKHATVVGVVDNDGIFIESVLLEVFDRLPH